MSLDLIKMGPSLNKGDVTQSSLCEEGAIRAIKGFIFRPGQPRFFSTCVIFVETRAMTSTFVPKGTKRDRSRDCGRFIIPWYLSLSSPTGLSFQGTGTGIFHYFAGRY